MELRLKIKEAMSTSDVKSLRQVSKISGVSRGYISDLIAGKKSKPGVDVL
jgi:transcriptional regulator with XRE-family HTH domain